MEALVNFTKYELDYLAEQISIRMKSKNEFVSQRKAFSEFGEANVRRWVEDGLIQRRFRPNKIEYEHKKLVELQANAYDHLRR